MILKHKTFSVANIRLQTSADTIERRVSSLAGVFNVNVNVSSGTMDIDYNPEVLSEARIIEAVKDCGYIAYTQEIPIITEEEEEEDPLIHTLYIPSSLVLLQLVFAILKAPAWLAWIPFAILSFFCRDVFKNAVLSLRQKKADTYVLTLMAVAAAIVTALAAAILKRGPALYFFHACTILLAAKVQLVLLENNRRNMSRPLDEIRRQLPSSASVYENHTEHQVNTRDLHKDQIIVIRPGETVPADGRVLEGFAVMNESALTGIDLEVEKSQGSYVYANSRCVSGYVEIRAERIGNDTAMMQFAELAEKTASDNSFRTVFRSSEKYLILFALLFPLLCYAGWRFSDRDLFFASTVLLSVICGFSLESLTLARENAVMHAARQAAMKHVLFRNTKALEMVGRTDMAILEQDGTITESEFVVTDFLAAENVSVGRLEYIVYALESRNSKPFAKAITHYLRGRRISNINPEEFAALGAHGRRAVSTMSRFTAGTLDEILDRGIPVDEWRDTINELYVQGKRVMLFAEEKKVIGVIAALKPMIPDCEKAVEELQKKDVALTLITNGTWESSEILKQKLALESVVHSPTANEKDQLLRNMHSPDTITTYITGGYVSALQDADLTVAISAGTDINQDNADILLTRNRLEDFVYAMDLSSALNERIEQLQTYLFLYHGLASVLFGLLLPMLFNIAIPPVCASLCSLMVIYFILKYSAVSID